jgi:membrane protease YdiL (CAAX protease family)
MGVDLAGSAGEFFVFALFELVFFVGPLVVMKLKHQDVGEQVRKRVFPRGTPTRGLALDILLGVAVGYALVVTGGWIYIWNRQLIIQVFGPDYFATGQAGGVNTAPPSMTPVELWLGILVQFVLVGFCEEFFFRGILFSEGRKRGLLWGVLASSGVFAVYHVFPGVVPVQTLVSFWFYYFYFGVMLALLYHCRRGSLVAAVVAHGMVNSIFFWLRYA